MGRKIITLLFLGILTAPLFSWATPPESLEVSYNQSAGTLTVSGHHPTQDRFEHFIRIVTIIRNQDEPQKFYLTRQDSASEFKVTVPVKSEPGDTIRITVNCSQGGAKSAEIQILKIVQKVIKPEISAQELKAIKDKDHQNLPIIP